jgi:outer membrane protein insertion porin family
MDGRDVLSFREVRASISLENIWNKELLLSLDLLDGIADGVGPDSGLYKFIDQLTTPSSASNPMIRVRLTDLQVKRATFREPLKSGEIQGRGLNMVMARLPSGGFQLTPQLKELSWARPDLSAPSAIWPLSIGNVSSIFVIENGIINFQYVSLKRNTGEIKVKGESIGSAINGTLDIHADSETFGIKELVQGALRGQGTVTGTFRYPVVQADLELDKEASNDITLLFGSEPVLKFDQARSQLRYVHEKESLNFSPISAEGSGVSLDRSSYYSLNRGYVDSKLGLQLDHIQFEDFNAYGVTLQIASKGDVSEDIHPALNIGIESLDTGFSELKNVTAAVEFIKEGASVSVTSQGGEIKGKAILDNVSYLPKSGEVEFSNFGFAGEGLIGLAADVSLSGIITLEAADAFKGVLRTALDFRNGQRLLTRHNVTGGKGEAVIESEESEGEVGSVLRMGPRGGTLRVEARSIPQSYAVPLCINGAVILDYDFEWNSLLAGNGRVDIGNLNVGCPPAVLEVELPPSLLIRKGEIRIEQARVSAVNQSLGIKGSIGILEGIKDMQLNGSMSLESIATLFPSVDELRGTITTDATLSGPWSSIAIMGNANLAGVHLAQGSAGIKIDDLKGDLKFDNQVVEFGNLSATLNQGKVFMAGQLFPFALARSKVDATFEDVLVEPLGEAYLVGWGEISLGATPDLKPRIEGDIVIKEAEFRKSFDFFTLIRSIRQAFLEKGKWSPPASIPEILLSLNISAERDLFIATNIMEAELNAQLSVVGTLASPVVKGELNTLGGWFGLNNRQFDINSGRISFEGIDHRPTLFLVGETVVRTRAGETTTVVLEAKGPLENPEIDLTSDRDIPKSELLTMLATSQQGVLQDLTRRSGSAPLSARDIFQFGLPSVLGGFFDDITRIDYFGLEPTYNALTASVQPSMVAEKRILSTAFIRAQALFGGNVTSSSLKIHNRFGSKYELSFGVESASTNLNNAIAVDLSYNLSKDSQRETFLKIAGHQYFDTQALKDAGRLTEIKSITQDRILPIKERLLGLYRDAGFFDTTVKIKCRRSGAFCRTLSISIDEGPQTLISDIQFIGDEVSEFNLESPLRDKFVKTPAKRSVLGGVSKAIVKMLRKKDHLRASATATLVPSVEPNRRTLLVDIVKGTPVHVTFWGARIFDEHKLKEAMGLFDYDKVITTNTLRRGVEGIERLYIEDGYLFTVVNYEEVAEGDVAFFHVYIQEERRVVVRKVIVKGNTAVSTEKLFELMGDAAADFQQPRYAIEQDIEYHENDLRQIYSQLGFFDVEVVSRIKETDSPGEIDIEYRIEEGQPRYSPEIVIEPGLIASSLDTLSYPYSTTKASQAVADRIGELVSKGYRSATFESRYDVEAKKVVYKITPGELTTIGEITIEGREVVKLQEILKRLKLKRGDPWQTEDLERARRSLTRIGLFSSVEMLPEDGALDSLTENLLVRVKERELKSTIVGVGANSLFGVHVFGEVEDRGFFADGRKITSRVDLYVDSGQAAVSQGVTSILYTHPEVWGSSASLYSDLRFQKLTNLTQEFNVERLSTTNSLHFPLSSSATTSLGYTLASETITDVPDDVRLGQYDSGNVILGFIGGTTTFDFRDQPLRPHSGFTSSFDYKVADPALFSQPSFYMANSRTTGLLPLSDRFTLAGATRWGWADSLRGNEVVPISQRFYLGGRLTVRGFRENSLGPQGADGHVIGGEVVQNNSFELQYLAANELETHVFWDTGNMALQSNINNLFNYRKSVGFGTRYLSPIGPIGFDIGFPLDEQVGEPSVRVHFNIGSQF